MFNTEETKYLDEIGKCKECFDHVLKHLSKERQNSLMKLNRQQEEGLQRIRSISHKFHTTSFMAPSRNKSTISSKSPKLKHTNSKKVICNSKMVSFYHQNKRSLGPKSKQHSVDSSFKSGKYIQSFSLIDLNLGSVNRVDINLKVYANPRKINREAQNSRNHSNSHKKNPSKVEILSTSDLVKFKERKTFEPKSKLSKTKQTLSKKSLFKIEGSGRLHKKSPNMRFGFYITI